MFRIFGVVLFGRYNESSFILCWGCGEMLWFSVGFRLRIE